MSTREVVLDERRRTSLAKVGRKDDRRYLVDEFPDGTLILTPAVTISELELAVLRNPAITETLKMAAGRKRPKLRSRGSFANRG